MGEKTFGEVPTQNETIKRAQETVNAELKRIKEEIEELKKAKNFGSPEVQEQIRVLERTHKDVIDGLNPAESGEFLEIEPYEDSEGE